MPELKNIGKTKGRRLPFIFSSALSVALHCLLLLIGAGLISSGALPENGTKGINMSCAFLACIAVSMAERSEGGRGELKRALLLILGYCFLLALISALGNGRIMDNNATLPIWGCGAVGTLLGKVTKLCKCNKGYRNGINSRGNITRSYHA